GLLGNAVEFIYQDNRSDVGTAVERTRQLIERDGVLAVIGPIRSSARDAMVSVHRRLRTPLLHAAPYEGEVCDRYVFSFNTAPSQELDDLVPELLRRAGRSFFLLGADDERPRILLERARHLVGRHAGVIA